jgi:hypothetical protein
MFAPFVFSCIHPYLPVAVAVLFYSEFMWGCAPSPLSSGSCHTLAAVGRLLLSKHTGGGGATPAFSSWPVYLQFMWGSGTFHTTATVTSFPHSKVAGWEPPLLPSQLACLFTVHMRECPFSTLWISGSPALFVMCLFLFVCFSGLFIIQFGFFPLGGGQSVQGVMLICPREYVMLLICSLGGLPNRVGSGIWWHGSPPGFSI